MPALKMSARRAQACDHPPGRIFKHALHGVGVPHHHEHGVVFKRPGLPPIYMDGCVTLIYEDADHSKRQPHIVQMKAWDALNASYPLEYCYIPDWHEDHLYRIHGGRTWYTDIRYANGRREDKVKLYYITQGHNTGNIFNLRAVQRIIHPDTVLDCICRDEFNLFFEAKGKGL